MIFLSFVLRDFAEDKKKEKLIKHKIIAQCFTVGFYLHFFL